MSEKYTSKDTTTSRGIQYIEQKTVVNFNRKIIEFLKAGLPTSEIADILKIPQKKVSDVMFENKHLFITAQVCYGKKNESQDENMYFGITPKYNSHELSGEELEIFNEGSAYKFKLEYEE